MIAGTKTPRPTWLDDPPKGNERTSLLPILSFRFAFDLPLIVRLGANPLTDAIRDNRENHGGERKRKRLLRDRRDDRAREEVRDAVKHRYALFLLGCWLGS